MPKYKKIMMQLAKGGTSQSNITRMLHVSKRDVSLAAKALKESHLSYEEICELDEATLIEHFFKKDKTQEESHYLQPDYAKLVERKKKSRKIPIKLFWHEYCEAAISAQKFAYSYQTFCERFSEVAHNMDATRHFVHEPAEKCYIDWAGDCAFLTDRYSGAKSKIYLLVVILPFSSKFWAEGFCDMKQPSWQAGHIHAFESFGGVPRIFVPDNAATATNRSPERLVLINREYERFAQHYGAAVLPARVRKPRDKSVSESTVDLIERWIIGPALEMTFYTLEEFNEFCFEKVALLNERPFSAKEGSRNELYEAEERPYMNALPAQSYEMCEWRRAKVAPDYHITLNYMHYSVPYKLLGAEVDIKISRARIEIMYDGQKVATHPKLVGRKGQWSTDRSHMPDNHREQLSPWSRERFESWADKVGPQTGEAIRHLMDAHVIVEQSFNACRNILSLSKRYSAQLLESACTKINAVGTAASYSACKNIILAEKAALKKQESVSVKVAQPDLCDRAKDAGRLRGAKAYKRGGRPC